MGDRPIFEAAAIQSRCRCPKIGRRIVGRGAEGIGARDQQARAGDHLRYRGAVQQQGLQQPAALAAARVEQWDLIRAVGVGRPAVGVDIDVAFPKTRQVVDGGGVGAVGLPLRVHHLHRGGKGPADCLDLGFVCLNARVHEARQDGRREHAEDQDGYHQLQQRKAGRLPVGGWARPTAWSSVCVVRYLHIQGRSIAHAVTAQVQGRRIVTRWNSLIRRTR